MLFSSCSDNGGETKNKTINEIPIEEVKQAEIKNGGALEKDGIKLSEVNDSPEYNDAKLKLTNPNPGAARTGINNFSFSVENYNLGNQTPDADAKLCANSAKGQHIHFILNNAPYKAYYISEFDAELKEGNNVVLAFLSRSYHESIKTKDAYILSNLKIGDVYPENEFAANGKHLFYSRPKGEYIGNDAKKLLLDFYLVNTTLSEDGNKVRATINGIEFTLTKWVPYFIEGLPMGENTIKLELTDKNGDLITGPFNDSGERKITLLESEPLPPEQN